jgi:hypothetical protein
MDIGYSPNMTKKHFILMAETIKRIVDMKERRQMAELNAQVCAKSNPRFDRARFMKACGL